MANATDVQPESAWYAAMSAQMDEEEMDSGPFPPLYTAIVGPIGTVGEHGDNWSEVERLLQSGVDVNERRRRTDGHRSWQAARAGSRRSRHCFWAPVRMWRTPRPAR